MSGKRRIEGDMACDAGFLVLPECLDQSFESRTPCFPLTVRVPRLDQSCHEYNLLAPLSESRAEWDAADAAELRDPGDSDWGSVQTWRDPENWEDPPIPTSVVVERLRFITEGAAGDDDEFQSTVDHFAKHQADWWTRLAEWIGVVSSQDLIGLGKNRHHSFNYLSMWIADATEGQEPGFGKVKFGDMRPYCGIPLSKAQLDSCMMLTGQLQRPPVAWLLLRDARSLLRSDEYRRAVLDVGAATELALTAMLDQHAVATNSPDISRQVRQTKMLGPMRRLAKDLIPEALPDQLYERVISPRNAATHEAEPLTKEVAEAAIAAATELLNTAYSLSDFGLSVETGAPTS